MRMAQASAFLASTLAACTAGPAQSGADSGAAGAPATHTFTATGGTAFHHNAGCSGDDQIALAIGEPSVEVPIDDLVAFVEHLVTERRISSLRTGSEPGELFERNKKPGWG